MHLIKKLFEKYGKKIETYQDLTTILSNSGWLLFDRILKIIIGIFVGVWIARYLGPVQFGEMSYALSIVAVAGAVGGLGLNGIVVRELVRHPGETKVILGTTFVLQVFGGIVAWGIAVIAIIFLRADDHLMRLIVSILGSMSFFKCADAIRYYFESKVKSRSIVIIENSTIYVMALFKIWLIYIEASFIAFIWTAAIEAALISILIIIGYSNRVEKIQSWRFDFNKAKHFLRESWPLILMSISVMINMRLDQILLGTYAGSSQLGNYSAAAKLAEAWLILPSILGPSLYPILVAAREKNKNDYQKLILKISKIAAIFAVSVAFLISISAHSIVQIVYGDAYKDAGLLLALLIWSGLPYIATFAISQIFYLEGLLHYSLYLSILIVVLNVGFSVWLIPIYQGVGAAISVITTAFLSSAFSMIVIYKKTNIFKRIT
jgi:O-antigen/teichoic acid export membrane protein